MDTFAPNSTRCFTLSSQLFFRDHAMYKIGIEREVRASSASARGPNFNHVTNKSHEQKTSNTRKDEMEDKDDLSLSPGSGTARGAGISTIDSRKLSAFENQKGHGVRK